MTPLGAILVTLLYLLLAGLFVLWLNKEEDKWN